MDEIRFYRAPGGRSKGPRAIIAGERTAEIRKGRPCGLIGKGLDATQNASRLA